LRVLTAFSAFARLTPAVVTPRYLTHRVSVQCPTLTTLLVTVYRLDANTPAQNRSQLGVAELVNGAVAVDVASITCTGLPSRRDLLERPTLLVFDRALDKVFGQLVEFLALLLAVRIDSVSVRGAARQSSRGALLPRQHRLCPRERSWSLVPLSYTWTQRTRTCGSCANFIPTFRRSFITASMDLRGRRQ
jgi:hypothetical protein